MKVEDVYSPNIVSVPCSCTLQQAAIVMRDKHVGALLVIDDDSENDRALGVLTDRDIVLLATAEGTAPAACAVSEVMTPSVATVSGDDDLREAMWKMRDHGVRRLGVTDDSGELVGILSMDDILATLGSEFGVLAEIVLTGRENEMIMR